MDGRTVRGNQKEQIFGIGTSCIHGRFVQGEIWCKILRLASGEVIQISLSASPAYLKLKLIFKGN